MSHKKTNTAIFHFYEVPMVVNVTDTQSRMVGARGWEEGGDGDLVCNGYSFCFAR